MNQVISVLSCTAKNAQTERDSRSSQIEAVLDEWLGYQGTTRRQIHDEPGWSLIT